MKVKLVTALVVGMMFMGLSGVYAQAKAGPPSVAALKAAEEMLEASGMGAQFEKNIGAMINQYSASVPADKRDKFVSVMKKFLNKYCSWPSLKQDIINMYAREFSESELKQLAAFYRTPLGIKLNQKMPVLMQKSMTIGQERVQAHQSELQKMMADELK